MTLWGWLGRTIGIGSRFSRFWASFAGAGSDAGEVVTADRTMGIAAYARGVRLWATTISTLPLNFYRQPADGSDPVIDRDNPYDLVCRVSPNEDLTPSEFWEAIIGCEKVNGNGFAKKLSIGSRLVGLELLPQCEPYRRPENYKLWYRGTEQNGDRFDLPASQIFHLRGFSLGGDWGISPIQASVNPLGNVLSANKTAGGLLRSGMSGSGFLETNQVFNEPDREKLEKIMAQYAGSEKAGKMMILEGGMKYNRLSLSPIDAQLILLMGYGIEEIARILDIPPILLGHSQSGQTMWGTGVEAIIQGWYTLGLRAELKRIENAINKRIIAPADRGKIFAKYNVDGLLRGDSAAQAALFSAAAQNGWMTRNEIRKLLDLPPLPGGDVLTVQVNMAILKDLGSVNPNVAANAKNALLALLGIEDQPKAKAA